VTAICERKDDLSVEWPVICYFNPLLRAMRGISLGIFFVYMLIQRCGGRDIVVFESMQRPL